MNPVGYKFSYPTLKSGWLIMVHIDTTKSIWSFLDPLEPSLWVAFFATSVGVGLLVLLVEMPWGSVVHDPTPILAKLCNLQWASLAVLVHSASQFSPRTPGGRVILLGYGFLVLIVINVYISSMAAKLTMSAGTGIQDIGDLMDKPTGIYVGDRRVFSRFNLKV